MNFSWKNYYKPTPAKIRKRADAVFCAVSAVAGLSFMALNNETISFILLFVAFVSKLISNLFTEDNEDVTNSK